MAADRSARRLRLIGLPFLIALMALTGVGVGSHHPLRAHDTQTPVPLEPGKTIERPLSGAESHAYLLKLAAGDAARVTVEQRGIDIGVRVLDSADDLVIYVDDEPRRTQPEHVILAPDAPAEYRVHVEARYRQEPQATYAIRLHTGPVTADDRAAFDARRLRIESEAVEGKTPAEALQLMMRALTLAEQAAAPDGRFVAELLTRAGELAATAGNRAEAERLLERAVGTADTALGRDHPQTAHARARLGSFYMNHLDDVERAEPLLMEGIAATERALGSSHPRAVTITNSLAVLYTRRADYGRALQLLQKGLAAAEQSLDARDPLFIQFVNNLGDLHRRLGEFEKAEPYLTRALALLEQAFGPDHLRVATPLVNLAVVARERQEYARAFELLNRAYTIRTKALGESSTPSAETVVLMANVHHARAEYGEAVALLEKALATLERTAGPYHRSTMMALANLSRAKAAMGEVEAAIEYEGRVQSIVEINLALNLRIGSERQKLAYFDETNQRTDRILSFSNQLAPDNAAATRLAVEVVLQRKGRVLDAVAGGFAVLREQLDRDSRRLFEELQATTSRFAALALNGPGRSVPFAEYEKELRTLETRQEALESEISRASGAFRAATQPLTFSGVQKALPPEAALVEFIKYEPYSPTAREERLAYGDPRFAAYVIRGSGTPIRADLGPASAIDAAVSDLRESLRDPRRADSKQRARALDRLVLEPIRATIGKVDRLLISPDGALNLVPFEALVDADGRYAVESYSISYLTSGRDLLRLKVPRESRSTPVVIANPDFGEPASAGGKSRAAVRSVTSGRDLSSTYFAPLSGTAQEAKVIQSLFPQATILTGTKATKSALRTTTAPAILHIASHGFFLEDVTPPPGAPNTRTARSSARLVENPLVRSGIALAQANLGRTAAGSGILTALEASSLNLWGTQLVTLSACDTGIGEVRQGEGVYGLRRAFLLAGAESIMMSLWPVSDYVTRQMMQGYYSGLKKGLGRGDALRAAQLEMLRSRPHPFFWAGFIQAGAWGPVRTPTPPSN